MSHLLEKRDAEQVDSVVVRDQDIALFQAQVVQKALYRPDQVNKVNK